MRCRSCGACLSLDEYYRGHHSDATDDELERLLANLPINRL
ncbi:MAG: hypothetical protein V2A77_09705 [Pseudomonadota bacterium]